MKIIKDKAASLYREIPYTFFKQPEETNYLTIILPGAGYTTQAPLLHFTTGIFWNKGHDVLHVNYQYSQEEMSALEKDEFTADVLSVIELILDNHDYSHLTIVAKSIGTVAMTYLLEYPRFKTAKTIWLTPLLQRNHVYEALLKCDHEGIVIIGNEDPCFIEERFEEIKKNQNLTLHLVEGANHSLELKNNIIGSIDVLKDIMKVIDDF